MSDQFDFDFEDFDFEDLRAMTDPESLRLEDLRPMIDPERAREVTEDAIFRAEHLTDDARKIEMLQAVRVTAQQNAFFTADEVWDTLGEVGDGYGGRDNGSGLGPVMRMAMISGLIENTRTFRRSQRPPTHCRPLLVWRSLIWSSKSAEGES